MTAKAERAIISLRCRAAPVLKSAGFSVNEIARVFGVASAGHYIPRAGHVHDARDPEREQAMLAAFRRGDTLEDIGAVHRVTSERVRQILKRLGVNRNDGGVSLRRKLHAEAAAQRRDLRSIAKHGMPHAEYRALLAVDRDKPANRRPIRAFCGQRNNAIRRGIKWNFTLAQWWAVWSASGKWNERGRGHGAYVMARKADAGAYEPGNVEIILADQNGADSFIHTPPDKRRKFIARDEHGLTPSERRVYEVAKEGLGPKAVSEHLQMNRNTVAQHLQNIRRRAPHLPFAQRAA